ncbi:MAG: hypothetical protein SGILL_006476 [Bacillariaceae sp.]
MQRPSQDDQPQSRRLLSRTAVGLQSEAESSSVDEKAVSAVKGNIGSDIADASDAKRAVDGVVDKLGASGATEKQKPRARAADESSAEKVDETATRKKARPPSSPETEANEGKDSGLNEPVVREVDSEEMEKSSSEDGDKEGETKISAATELPPQEAEASSRGKTEANPEEMTSLLYTDNIMAAAAATNDEHEASANPEQERLLASLQLAGLPTFKKQAAGPQRSLVGDAAPPAISAALFQQVVVENKELKQRNVALQQELDATKQLLFRALSNRDPLRTPSTQSGLDASQVSRQLDLLRAAHSGTTSNLTGSVLQQQLQSTGNTELQSLLSVLGQQQPSRQQLSNQSLMLSQLLPQAQRPPLLSAPLVGALSSQQVQNPLLQLQQRLLFSQRSQHQLAQSQLHSSAPNLSALLPMAAAREALLRQAQRQQATDASSAQMQDSMQRREEEAQSAPAPGSKPK